jgi:site-specific recombinase XerD
MTNLPSTLVVAGPLAAYEAGLREELARQGYAPSSVADVVRTMARLSAWLAEAGIPVARLGPDVVEEFTAARHAPGYGVGPLLRHLRTAGVAPGGGGPVRGGAVEELLAAYRGYLLAERGLAAESVRCYVNQARFFLSQFPAPLGAALAGLDAGRVRAFMLAECPRCGSVWSAKALVTAVRSLLRFLHVEGLVPGPLAGAVPAVAGWRLAALPRGLEAGQVAALLASCDMGKPAGVRDRAILTMLARLGLRGAEVAALELGDVDWRAGEMLVRGKGSRRDRLPLPADVGQALAAYLTGARPVCACRALFVTARAPRRGLTPAAVRGVVAQACIRAGLPRFGGHRLRHSVATDLLRAGAGLAEVGQVLRHRSQLATAGYAKVDRDALGTLARPWPGSLS